MKLTKLIISILIPLIVGYFGSLVTTPSIDTWYAALNKPAFNPPNWIFFPVWTLLFILMGVSLYLVWEKFPKKSYAKAAIAIFGLQLGLNLLWSVLFFGLKNPLYAAIEIVVLWVAILSTIIKFWKISKAATYLLLPYITWTSFAVVLNYAIVLLN